MKRNYTRLVNNELATQISCASYLADSHERVLVLVLSNPDIKINEELFEKYTNDYTESYIYEQELKSFMEQNYVKIIPVLRDEIEWTLTYSTGKLQLSIDEDIVIDDTEPALFKNGFERIN